MDGCYWNEHWFNSTCVPAVRFVNPPQILLNPILLCTYTYMRCGDSVSTHKENNNTRIIQSAQGPKWPARIQHQVIVNAMQSSVCCGYRFAFCSALQDINRDVQENVKAHENDKRNHSAVLWNEKLHIPYLTMSFRILLPNAVLPWTAWRLKPKIFIIYLPQIVTV